ncbi:Uncharacterised protein [Candidatus Gugararchaeum adminiculabundum]|nr:Uncharacterised protein [Candidatus Gugararchaeum adminiculabundum]
MANSFELIVPKEFGTTIEALATAVQGLLENRSDEKITKDLADCSPARAILFFKTEMPGVDSFWLQIDYVKDGFRIKLTTMSQNDVSAPVGDMARSALLAKLEGILTLPNIKTELAKSFELTIPKEAIGQLEEIQGALGGMVLGLGSIVMKFLLNESNGKIMNAGIVEQNEDNLAFYMGTTLPGVDRFFMRIERQPDNSVKIALTQCCRMPAGGDADDMAKGMVLEMVRGILNVPKITEEIAMLKAGIGKAEGVKIKR